MADPPHDVGRDYTAELSDRLQGSVLASAGLGALVSLDRASAGASGTTYLAQVGERCDRVVVKVAPPGLAPVRNRDVIRQARLLRALDERPGIVVPKVLFEDAGEPPEIPPLFGMAFVDGECFEPLSDGGHPPPRTVVGQRALAAASMLANLHSMSPARLGFVDEEEVKLHDEANRWIRLFGTVEDELRSGADECACLILEDVPKSGRSAIVHGDYRLGNIIFSGSRPSAVIDWEIWAVGDPRTDLAWFLTICDPTRPQTIKGRLGMPPLDDLKRRYEETKGEATTDLAWFLALARFKNAATVAAIIKHNRQRAIPQTRAESLAPLIAPLLESVRRMLSERS